MTMLGTFYLLNKTPLGPNNVATNLMTQANPSGNPTSNSINSQQTSESLATNAETDANMALLNPNLASDALVASLAFSALSAAGAGALEDENDSEDTKTAKDPDDGGGESAGNNGLFETSTTALIKNESGIALHLSDELLDWHWRMEEDDDDVEDASKTEWPPLPQIFHHSTSVLLRPNRKMGLLEKSYHALSQFISTEKLGSVELRLSKKKQCPLFQSGNNFPFYLLPSVSQSNLMPLWPSIV